MKNIHFNIDKTKNYADLQNQIINDICQFIPNSVQLSQSENSYINDALNVSLFVKQKADIYIGHNLSDKNYLWTKNDDGVCALNSFQTVFVPGYWLKSRLENSNQITLRPDQIIAIGSPRVDILRRLQAEFNARQRSVNEKKTILWAPLHDKWKVDGQHLSSYPDFEPYLDELSNIYDIIKILHPRNRKDKSAVTCDLIDADIVISDYSSVVYEAWALGKPVIFPRWILGDKILEKAPSSAEGLIFKSNIGYHPNSFDELKNLLTQDLMLSDDVHAFMESYLVNYRKSTQASESIANYIIYLADEETRFKCEVIQVEAEQHISDKNWLKAEDCFRQLIELSHNNADYYNKLAQMLRKQGKWWQEVEALRQAIALADQDPTWHYRLGESLEVMNRFQEAAVAFGNAIELKKGKAEAQWYYRQGYCYEHEGNDGAANPLAANKAYDLALTNDTKLSAKRYGIGVFHQARGHWPQAAVAFQLQLKINPWDAELHYRLGMAYDRCYEWVQAEDCYKKALTLDKNQPDWHYRLGFVLERQGKNEQAALAYQFAAINCDKHRPYWFYRWGYVLEQLGDYKFAAEAYLLTQQEPTLDRIREDSVSKNNQLLNYSQQFNQNTWVIEQLTEHLKKDTTNPEVWYKLGNCYERKENWQAAAVTYQQAIARQNDHTPDWYFRLGYVLTQTEQYQLACEAFRNTRILQKAYGITEKPLNENQNSRLILSYSEYYNCLEVQKNTILFESFNGSSITCNPYAISEYMLKSKVYEGWSFIWVLNDIQRVPEHLKANKNIYYISKGSDAYLRAICQAEYLVNNSGFPPYFIRKENQKYLATWHGTPLKTLGKEQKYKFFDHKRTQRNFLQASHIISPNAHTSKIQMKSYDINNIYIGRYAETGYPRIDLTINASHEERSKMLSTMGLDTATPIILYAPTWRGTLQDVEFDVEKLKGDIESILGTGCQVIFRGHSLLEGILEKINIGCTVVPESIDTNSLLSIVDILITDYSSIFFDFIPLNRPIIYYTYDIEDYEKERGLYFDIKEMPGGQCQNIEMVVETVKAILFSQNFELRGYSEAIKKYNAHDDGKASERVVQFFINACDKYDIEKFGSDKKNILFYPGGIEPNGITTSFLNLINNIDKNSVNPVIAFNPNPIESDVEKKAQFDRLDYNLDFIPRYGNVVMTLEERYLRVRAEKNYYNNISDEELDILRNMYAREFRRIFGLSKFDAVIHFSGYDHFWASILSSANVPKKSIYLHNDLYSEFLQKFPYLNIIFKYYKFFDSLVSVSNLTSGLNKKNLSSRYQLNKELFQYCNNLQNSHEVLQCADEDIDEHDQKLFDHASHVFITLGRLSLEKDHEKLIKSFAVVLEQEPKAKLLILGDGPLKQHLIHLVVELKLTNSVHLLGRRFNPFPLLKRADCFVLSSNHEGQPMVLFEAMILKKPIISTDIIGSRSAIEGRTGHLVENSQEGLIQGMLDFLNGNLSFPEYDITDYQKNALEMFYTKVCGLEELDA